MAAQPDAAMLAPIEKIARFIETCDDTNLSGFADEHVAIIENFAPFLFDGRDAVARCSRMTSSVRSGDGSSEKMIS
jgi:hypothetical protein